MRKTGKKARSYPLSLIKRITIANFDGIVVGASVAGSTTAALLAQKGFRVLLVDKATFPREKILILWSS